MKLASQMMVALEAIKKDDVHDAAYTAGAAMAPVTDEALARMDWAAGLTDDQMRVLRLAVELVSMTETVHKYERDRQAFYWLRQGLEALP